MLSAVTWCFPWPQPSIGHTAQGSGYVQWWPWVDVMTCWAAAALCTHQDKQLTTTCWMDCFCFHSFDLCNIFVIECMLHFHCDLKHSCAHVFIHLLLDQVSGVPASVDYRVHGHWWALKIWYLISHFTVTKMMVITTSFLQKKVRVSTTLNICLWLADRLCSPTVIWQVLCMATEQYQHKQCIVQYSTVLYCTSTTEQHQHKQCIVQHPGYLALVPSCSQLAAPSVIRCWKVSISILALGSGDMCVSIMFG